MQRLQSLSTGGKVLVASLIVALIAMFLPWYGWSSGGYGASVNGFHNFGWAYALFWLITAAFLVIRVFDLPVNLPGLPLVDWQLYIIGGVVMLFMGLLFYVNVPSGSVSVGLYSIHWGVSFGWWIGLVAAAGVIAGGWLSRPGIAMASASGSLGSAARVTPMPAAAAASPALAPTPPVSDSGSAVTDETGASEDDTPTA